MLSQFSAHIQEAAFEKKSLLDIAIDEYDRAAHDFYTTNKNFAKEEKGKPKPELTKLREKRQQKLDQTTRHLQHQRLSLLVMAQVQADLDEYRMAGKAAVGSRDKKAQQSGLTALQQEKHHGTGLRALEKFLLSDGRPRPSKGHTAHHIVPGKGRAQVMGRATRNYSYQARALLHVFGIRINDPDNGVWLPKSIAELISYAMPESKSHKQYHTNQYEEYVYRELWPQRSEQSIRNRL